MKKRLLCVNLLVFMLLCFLTSCSHEHAWTDWRIVTKATCTEKGVEKRTCDCGEEETRTIAEKGHSFGEWSVETDPTCTSDGTQVCVCSDCGQRSTRSVSAKGHSFGEWSIETAPTCALNGTQVRICSDCGQTSTESLPATGDHSYDDGVVTREPTCTSSGNKTFTCTTCQAKKYISIDALGHSLNNNNVCTKCGKISLNMSSSEIEKSKKVESMSHSVGEYSDHIKINITLKDENGYRLQIPVCVDVKIVDINDKVLYEKTLVKKYSQDSITIPNTDIEAGYSNIGTIHYTVYNDYVQFGTVSKELDDLAWTVDVELPELPKSIWYNYYGSNSSACKITKITVKVSGDDIYFYFEGEKTYDSHGNNYSASCKVGWKLYDAEGYVIADGTLYSKSIAVGEKFKNDYVTAYNCVEFGESYKLVIMDVN